jgi:hypothetical protein
MIYRIIGASEEWRWDPEAERWGPAEGALKGAMLAGMSDFGDLKYTHVANPRTRFWFTEAGWSKYGQGMLAAAYQSGRTWRLLRQKNPPRSAVVYRDKWQLALLPVKGKR